MNEQKITRLLEDTKRIIKKHEDLDRENGSKFNIFRILGRYSDEVYGHSAFIGTLLDPKGSHCQGSVYLDKFIEFLFNFGDIALPSPKDSRYNIIDIDKSEWIVEIERSFSQGRIDILIHDKNNEVVIAIENKIYAEDQPGQLARYKNILNNFNNNKTSYLLYLNLFGSLPNNNSLYYGNYKITDADYIIINYENFISTWIDSCINLTSVVHIKYDLIQYKNCIGNLTGRLGSSMKNDLISTILNSNLQAALIIEKAIIPAKKRIFIEFLKYLEQKMKEVFQGYEIEYNNEMAGGIDKTVDLYYNVKNRSKYFGYKMKILENNICAYLEVRINERLYFGFYPEKTDGSLPSNLINLFYKSVGNKMTDNETKINYNRIAVYPHEELNFLQFNKTLATFDDPDIMKNYVDTFVTTELKECVDVFRGLCKQPDVFEP